MARGRNTTAYFILSSLLFSVSPTQILAKESNSANSKNAAKLMSRLNEKINKSLAEAEKRPLLPYDKNRLTLQCLSDEMQYLEIEKSILLPLRKMLSKRSVSGFNKLIAPKFSSNNFISKNKSHRNIGAISFTKYTPSSKKLSAHESKKIFKSYISEFDEVIDVDLFGSKIYASSDKRVKNQKITQAKVWAQLDIRGKKDKSKYEQRSHIQLDVKLIGGEWKVAKVNFLSTEKLSSSSEFYRSITNETGVAKQVPSYLRREAIRRGGYAMALEDFNNNKSLDLFVATVGETVLLEGSKDFKYKEVLNEKLTGQTFVKAASFADFNNNGSQDLLLVRFAPNESQSKDDRSDIVIYKNDHGKLEKQKNVVSFSKDTNYAMPLALADFDQDGALDFYVGFPGAKDFTTLEEAVQNKSLATQGIFFNNGAGKFKDDPYKSFENFYDNKLSKNVVLDDLSRIFPHSALAADIDGNGTSDLLVIDDRGNLSPVYLNKGNADFIYGVDKIGTGLMDYGMGAEVSDLNNDGRYDFVMSSVNFNASKRIKDSCEMNWSVQNTVSAGVNGLRSFSSTSNKKFAETTQQNGFEWVGQGAGGVKSIDYNNDGLEDIYISNGLWTGSEKDQSQDLSSHFVVASLLGILEDDLRSSLRDDKVIYGDVKENNDFKSLLFRSDSQSAIMDILSFYRGDIFEQKKLKSAPSLAGHQRNKFFHNNGDGTYSEIGYMLGLDSTADGYMIATGDIDKDGKMDIFLRNADPGYLKNQFPAVEIFKNVANIPQKSVQLKLVGTKSNRDAIGALITAKVGDKVLNRQLIGSSGTVQSEKLIHLGLGDESVAKEITIKWPSGNIQKLANVRAGLHTVTEINNVKGKVIEVSKR